MISHILIRQTDAYVKETDYEHDTHYFSCKDVCDVRPRTWIEGVEDMRPQEDPEDRSKDDLIHIQLNTTISK